MKMFPEYIISELGRNKLVFQSLLDNLSKEKYMWKPSPKKWCLLEIICHLLDEELDDFRTRTQHALETPDKFLKPISPRSWPIERKYLERDFNTVLYQFITERDASVKWLKSLENVPWENYVEHQDLGKLSAKDFLENWLAHDHIHIRQINNVKQSFFKKNAAHDLSYAGNW